MSIREEAVNWYVKKLGKQPDIEDPQTYNEKLQWLKLYDQDSRQIVMCDKKSVKDYVKDIVGKKYVIPNTELYPAVWKTNHGNGGIRFVNSLADEIIAYKKLNKKMKKPFATWNGEWAYRFINPCIVKEMILVDNTDYKFHCVNGEIRFMQLIWDRGGKNTKECIFDSSGNVLDRHLYPNMQSVKRELPCSKSNYAELCAIAKELSRGWKYVRIDLYWSNNQPWFGEYTFWPGAGVYPENKDSLYFGDMLDFDLKTKKEPVTI